MTNNKLLLGFLFLVGQLSYGQDRKENETPKKNDQEVAQLWKLAESALRTNDFKNAEKQFTAILKLDPDHSLAHYYRGRVRFQSGNVNGSVADFDRHVALSPDLKSRQWERGISLYYQNKFKEGAKQFEIYQTYHDNDVENSAWRFLCVAKSQDIETARKNLLPIRNDRRIPMMQIYAMFQGKASPEKVIAAAEELPETAAGRNSALFYAHLYVGLLYEVEGKEELALKHIKVARKHKIGHYMWDVANVHVQLRSK